MDAIFYTPYVAADFANYFLDFAITLLINNEIGSVMETAALVPVSRYPNVPTLFISDPD